MDGFLIKPLDREKLADALAGLAARGISPPEGCTTRRPLARYP